MKSQPSVAGWSLAVNLHLYILQSEALKPKHSPFNRRQKQINTKLLLNFYFETTCTVFLYKLVIKFG